MAHFPFSVNVKGWISIELAGVFGLETRNLLVFFGRVASEVTPERNIVSRWHFHRNRKRSRIIFWRGADKFWVRRSICRDEKSALVQRDFPHPSAPSSSNIIVSFYGRDTQIRLPSISQLLPTKIVQQASKPCRGRLRSIIVSLARFQTCLEEHADQTHKRLA